MTITAFGSKPLQAIMEESQKYRKLQYKWFVDNETGDSYQLIYFAHDNDGKLNVVLNHAAITQIKRVVYYKTFFNSFRALDPEYQSLMVAPEEGID